MATLPPGIIKHAADAEPGWQASLWRDLTFAVPFKGGNYSELSQGVRPATTLQNVSRTAGLYGSALDRPPNTKAFAHYQPNSQQYTFAWMPEWTLAWSTHLKSFTYLPGPPLAHWYLMGVHLGDSTWWHGSMMIFRQWFSNNLRLFLYTSVGWQSMAWPLPASAWTGQHTFSLQRSYDGYPYQCELHVDGASYGVRSIGSVVVAWPTINMGVTIGGQQAHPTTGPSAMYGRWDAVCAWTRKLSPEELQHWHMNPLGMFVQRRRRVPTPPLYVPPPEPERPCDWFDPRTGAPWQADSAGQDWQAPRAGSSWSDGRADKDWHDDKAGSGWFDPKRCS